MWQDLLADLRRRLQGYFQQVHAYLNVRSRPPVEIIGWQRAAGTKIRSSVFCIPENE